MEEKGLNKKMIIADFSLLLVALFWGSNFIIIKEALDVIEPFTYLGLRFTLAALILAPFFWRRLSKVSLNDCLVGCLLGLFLFAGFAFQTVGLLFTTPANSGFISNMAVVIVPFLYFLVTRHFPGWWSFVGGGLAAAGLYFLSVDEALGFGLGDGLTLVCAFMFAAHVIAVGVHVRRLDPIVLAITQVAFTGLASLAVAVFYEPVGVMLNQPLHIWGAIFYAIIFCTIGAFVTQNIAQRHTSSSHTALILSLEAVFAGLFSFFFWDEVFTFRKFIGALLIFAGILIAELRPVIVAKIAARREVIARGRVDE